MVSCYLFKGFPLLIKPHDTFHAIKIHPVMQVVMSKIRNMILCHVIKLVLCQIKKGTKNKLYESQEVVHNKFALVCMQKIVKQDEDDAQKHL